MNKKGFTLVELLAVIVILGVISTIAVLSYSGQINNSKKKTYKIAEKSMISAVEDLYTDCLANSSSSYCKVVPDYNNSDTITLEQLIDAGFMSKVKDNGDTSKYCSGYVTITNKSPNLKLEYKSCLICSDYKSSDCNG